MFVLKIGDGSYPVTKDVIKIGRHTSNDIVLSETRVSRFHSEISSINGCLFLLDKRTVNGTFINDKRIFSDRKIELKPDDTIGVGCAAHEVQACTIKIDRSSDETPPNEDNEVVSTTNDSDQNLRNAVENDECHDAHPSCEEPLEPRLPSTEFPIPSPRDANELETKPVPPTLAVSEPADRDQSSSLPSDSPSLPNMKSEPSTRSPGESRNIPSLPSQTSDSHVKQPPADKIDMSVSAASISDAIHGVTTSPHQLVNNPAFRTAFNVLMKEYFQENISTSHVIPSLLNISNTHATSSSESSPSQISNSSTNVNEEPSAKLTSQPSSLGASTSKRKRVKSESNEKTPLDDPATPPFYASKTELIKVDLSDESENDVMEVIDEPFVAATATNEAASRVSRCERSEDVHESMRKQPLPTRPVVKSSREGLTSRSSSTDTIINLCDANEDADVVIEILDEEKDSHHRRPRQRKQIDPNTIIIEDTRDNEEVSDNLKPCSNKPVATTAPVPVEPTLSNKPKADFSQQNAGDCEQKVGLPRSVLTTPIEPPGNQPVVKLQQLDLIDSVQHSSSYIRRSKVGLQQPITPVENLAGYRKQVQFVEATVSTPVEPPPSDKQNILFQEPVVTPVESSSTGTQIPRFPLPKVEPNTSLEVEFQEPISAASVEPLPDKRVSDMLEEVISINSLPSDVPPTSSLLCEDKKPQAMVKCEPVAHCNYSNFDEIIALDSDDEDFPLSQLNTTQLNDVPDFSSTFERMFDDSEYIKEEPQMMQCNEDTWFEPFSQTEMVEGKHVARINTSEFEAVEEELQSMFDEMPDGALESQLEGTGDRMEVDEEPSSSKPYDFDDQPPSSEWKSVVKRKYELKGCNVILTDARPLVDRRSRKAQREADEKRRRCSLNFEETLLKLNDEPVKDAKKRPIYRSPQKVRKRKWKSRSPLMSVQEKRLIQEKRKEKLKEIAPKSNEAEAKSKDASRPDAKPVVKVTDKNRGSFLMDAMTKEPSLPKRPPKVELTTKDVSKEDKHSKCEPSTSKQAAPRLPVLKEKAGHSNNLKSSDANLADRLVKQYCQDDEKPGPSRRGSICEPEDNAFANALNKAMYEGRKEADARRKDKESTKKSANSTAQRHDSHNHKKHVSFDVPSQPKKPKKSCLKKAPVVFGPVDKFEPPKSKKRVRFHKQQDFRNIPRDALERRNNGIFAPAYKLNENLIREGMGEFDTAMVKVCSWNVKWLEEQQKCMEPPPLYPESGQLLLNSTLTVHYKEELKLIMFNNLWQAIFRAWNKPDNDYLPLTQYITEKPSLSTLNIESVDMTKGDKKMWTVIASRTVSATDSENDLSNGQVVILNFPIQSQVVGGATRKTMVFSYVSGMNKTYTHDKESIIQRMILKVAAKPFQIVLGEAKLKVLSYLKSSLRPFQALAMVTRSPLADLIIDPNKTFCAEPAFDPSSDWFHDKFLDPSQRRAVANGLNCILSPEPSICLVDGAPGTGKSQVIVSLMRELFLKNNRSRFPNDLRVLIVTAQDVVADDLSFRMEALNKKEKCFNFLRYGNCRGMHSSMKNCTLDKKIQDLLNEDQGNNLINLDEEKNNLKARIHSIKLVLNSANAKPEKVAEAKIKLTNNEREWNDMERENSKVIEQLKTQAAKEMSIESADVILTSVYSCWTSNFENDFVPTYYNKGDVHKFTVCIFDDASLINEIAMLVPMMLMVRSLILVGDHKNQINITNKRSPFFRLLTNCAKKAPSAVTTLNFQYRSPPHIMQWVDDFYDIKCKPRNTSQSGSKLKIKSFFVFDVPIQADDMNYRYDLQANYCSLLVEKLNQLVDDANVRIGIIVAQSSQKEIIKSSIGVFDRGRKMIVETLDEFSGREQDVVVLCLPYQCFQYASWLYVAVTRARGSLFVCGDFGQLKEQACVTSLKNFALERSLYSLRPQNEVDIPSSLILSSSS